MDLSNLKPAEGSTKSCKRIGRGQGSGHGGTSTRGNKGAKSRSGYSKKVGFEGGQMPIQRVVPKFGFTNINRVEYRAINLSEIQKIAERGITLIDQNVLIDCGLASKNHKIKILGNGQLNLKVDIKAHAFSKTAISVIESHDGSVEKI